MLQYQCNSIRYQVCTLSLFKRNVFLTVITHRWFGSFLDGACHAAVGDGVSLDLHINSDKSQSCLNFVDDIDHPDASHASHSSPFYSQPLTATLLDKILSVLSAVAELSQEDDHIVSRSTSILNWTPDEVRHMHGAGSATTFSMKSRLPVAHGAPSDKDMPQKRRFSLLGYTSEEIRQLHAELADLLACVGYCDSC